MIKNGCQVVLTNNFNEKTKFYEFINVEQIIRLESKNLLNVYFIALFACCREFFKKERKEGRQVNEPPADTLARDLHLKTCEITPAISARSDSEPS